MNSRIIRYWTLSILFQLVPATYSLADCNNIDAEGFTKVDQTDELVYQSISNNSDLDIAQINVKVADLNIKKSLSTFYPRIDLRSSSMNTKKYGQIPGVDTVLLQGNDNIDATVATLSTTLNVYNGGHSINTYRQAKKRKQLAGLQTLGARRQAAYKTIELYADAKKQYIRVQLLKTQTEFANFESKIIDQKAKQGHLSVVEYQKNQVDLKILSKDLEVQEGLYEDSLLRLVAFTGIPFDKLAGIRKNMAKSSDCYLEVFSNHASSGGKHSIDRLRLEGEIEDLNYERKKVLSRYKPSIDIVASIDATGYSTEGLQDSYSETRKDKRYYGIQLQWNLFDGFAKGADLRKVNLEMAKKHKQLEKQQQDELLERSKLTSELFAIQSEIRTLNKKSGIQSQEIQILKSQFSKGLVDNLLLKKTQLTHNELQLQLNKLRVELGLTQLKLHMLSQN